MKLLALSDIHGSTEAVERLGKAMRKADLVLLIGDLTHFGGRQQAESVLTAVRRHNRRILAVAGNCDRPDVDAYLASEGISVDGRLVERDGVVFAGLSGSLPAPGRTPNERSEEELERILGSLDDGWMRGSRLILISHQPPAWTTADRISSGDHVGSVAVRRFIEAHEPEICFTGHIHEARGLDRLGPTIITNAGPAGSGGFAAVDLDRSPLHVELGRACAPGR